MKQSDYDDIMRDKLHKEQSNDGVAAQSQAINQDTKAFEYWFHEDDNCSPNLAAKLNRAIQSTSVEKRKWAPYVSLADYDEMRALMEQNYKVCEERLNIIDDLCNKLKLSEARAEKAEAKYQDTVMKYSDLADKYASKFTAPLYIHDECQGKLQELEDYKEQTKHVGSNNITLLARIEKLRAALMYHETLDKIKYDLDASVYTLEDDEFGVVFFVRDMMAKALADDKEETK